MVYIKGWFLVLNTPLNEISWECQLTADFTLSADHS